MDDTLDPDRVRTLRNGGRLMGCNCAGRASTGATIVYQLHAPGVKPRTFATKAEADTELAKTGRGTIIRTTQAAR